MVKKSTMKKLIFLTIGLFFGAISSFAQVKCVSPNMDFNFSYKRCFVSGNTVVIDLTVTYLGDGTREFHVKGAGSRVFDDEGNAYCGYGDYRSRVRFDLGNTGESTECRLDIESGVPVKLRIFVSDVSEFAASFPKIVFSCYFGDYRGCHSVTISNVPIPRK